jgi:hypothetical protein
MPDEGRGPRARARVLQTSLKIIGPSDPQVPNRVVRRVQVVRRADVRPGPPWTQKRMPRCAHRVLC